MPSTEATVKSPPVLIVLSTSSGWSRGILRGFMAAALEHRWTLLHYQPTSDLEWMASEWTPAAAVIGPELGLESRDILAPATVVSVPVDRSANGIASVCLDEGAIAGLAFGHLLATGLRHVTTFRYDESAFAIAREQEFVARARGAGVGVTLGWGSDAALPTSRGEDPAAMVAWLRGLPKPCGIFACTDGWARTVARYARSAGLRVPEDLALIGADNDALECELMSPPLSSVMIPWGEVGRSAAGLVRLALAGQPVHGRRVMVSPTGVMPRRSTEVLAVSDELVASAVRWIRENSDRRLTVPMVARAVGGGRQRLERRFRAVLARTVQEEIRRAHVETARHLLATTRAKLPEIAKKSGFTSAGLLNAAFIRELGMPPGVYRRRLRREPGMDD
jgi:LacI family transcriptional regulator